MTEMTSHVRRNTHRDALQPFMEGQMSVAQAYEKVSQLLREFMIRPTREKDMALMVELFKAKRPETIADGATYS